MSHAGAESTLSTFTASDGDNLAVQDWHLPAGVAQRGAVLVVHGLGEHAGRYDQLARALNSWGFAVRSYDQYGHGESDGTRGGLPHANRLGNIMQLNRGIAALNKELFCNIQHALPRITFFLFIHLL